MQLSNYIYWHHPGVYTITYSGVAAVGNGNQIHTYVYINGVAVPGTETRTQA